MLITIKYILILGRGQTDFLKKICYSGCNSFSYVNAVKSYKFKAKDSYVVAYPLSLGNISKDFTNGNVKKSKSNEYFNRYKHNIK